MSRSVKRYHNAAQLLPKKLLTELQQYAAGKVLYVPHPITRREFNRLKVLDLRMQGYSISQIAYRIGITQRGVCKILQKDRERAFTLLRYFGRGSDAEQDGSGVDSQSGEMPPSRRSAPHRNAEAE